MQYMLILVDLLAFVAGALAIALLGLVLFKVRVDPTKQSGRLIFGGAALIGLVIGLAGPPLLNVNLSLSTHIGEAWRWLFPPTPGEVLHAAVQACWLPPKGTGGQSATLAFGLDRDGAITQPIRVESGAAEPADEAFTASAIRAIQRCAPYELDPAQYEVWRDVRVTFIGDGPSEFSDEGEV